MIDSRMVLDGRIRPDLFRWNGPIPLLELEAWLRTHHLQDCPGDLVHLWETTGGGDILESETILGPFGDEALGDSVEAVNVALRSQGLPERLLVFHKGLATSAVELGTGHYVELEPESLKPLRGFASLDQWYVEVLRNELGPRYGLGDPP